MNCLLALCAMSSVRTQVADLAVPANTAYGVPSADSLSVDKTGIREWSDPTEAIEWHGLLSKGVLTGAVVVRLPSGETSQLRLTIGDKSLRASVAGQGDADVVVPFGEFPVAKTGYATVRLEGVSKTGSTFGEIGSLQLHGTALDGAHFNLKPRRNTASVHLHYPVSADSKVAWFYNEVTPKTDPLYTYYEVCGFARGYFGLQVNHPNERRIIFSVWDSATGNDRTKVSDEDRTRLIGKGDGVVASGFGNEGTGGHSHLIYPWVVGQTYRFLVGAKVDGDATIYTGYFFDPTKSQWTLIASFRAPKDGKLLRGLYSFDENFGGSNGDLERLAEFKNQWIGSDDGQWYSLSRARFTCDGTGKADRLDYAAGAIGDRFFLRTGGFLDEPATPYGAEIVRSPGGSPPTDLRLPPVPPNSSDHSR